MRKALVLLATLFVLVSLALLGCQQEAAKPPEQAARPAASPAAPAATPAPAVQSTPAAKPSPAAKATPAAAPSKPATPPAKPLVLADSPLGPVTFEHAKHKLDCVTCHHASRPEKPGTAPQQACRTCHTKPAQPGMKTVRQAAFHNPTATAGTCIDCHKKSGGKAPTVCKQCHVKASAAT